MLTSTPSNQPRYTSSNDSVQITSKHVPYIFHFVTYCILLLQDEKITKFSQLTTSLYTLWPKDSCEGERLPKPFGVAFYLLISLNIATVGVILQYILSGANSLPERLVGSLGLGSVFSSSVAHLYSVRMAYFVGHTFCLVVDL